MIRSTDRTAVSAQIDQEIQEALARISARPTRPGASFSLHDAIGTGAIKGIHAIQTPAGKTLAATFGKDPDRLLDPNADAVVVFRRDNQSSGAGILYRTGKATSANRLDTTLELASGIVQQLTARRGLVEEAKERLATTGFHFDPDDDPETAPSHGTSVQVPSSDPVYGRLRVLVNAEKQLLAPVYGSSLDLDRILLSPLLGLGQRPFTLTVPAIRLAEAPRPFGDGIWASIICIGEEGFLGTPDSRTLIHELAHCWQAQHHYNPAAYMTNSVVSQGLAATIGGNGEGAYAYKPGRKFRKYGAEQLANQVERHFVGSGGAAEKSIADHMRAATPANHIDGDNVLAMLVPRWEKPGDPGVVL